MHDSCMATTTISLDDEAMKALRSAQQGGESYSRTLHRCLIKPAATAGELLAALETLPPLAPVDSNLLKAWQAGRGRRSKRV